MLAQPLAAKGILLSASGHAPDGMLTLWTTWPAGVPAGLEFSMQYWWPDALAPGGFQASNALLALVH